MDTNFKLPNPNSPIQNPQSKLPNPQSPIQNPQSKSPDPNSKISRVLLVEDNPGDVDLIMERLSETGGDCFSVESVQRLSEALARLKGADIDIVLLDLGLPDSSGVETLLKLRAAAPDLPVIVLTGNVDQQTGLAAVRGGAQDYLIKGQFSGSTLVRSIRYGLERARAAAALKSSEEFIRDILASVDEAFVVIDRDYRILTANRAYCEQSGKSLQNIIGRHCYEISHYASEPCRDPEHICALQRTFETGKSIVTLHTHTDDKGRQSQVEIKTYPMTDTSGAVKSVIEVINDVSERTRLEAQLRQSQKMEAIGTLAGGIAHDFNNILTAIIGFGEIVMEQLPPDSQIREDQAHVVAAGKRAKELVKQILTFSRCNEQELQPLMVQFVVKEALKLLRSSIPTSIEIREDIDTNSGLVMADPGQIHQVIMNLCTNAYQSMRETGGVMTVSLKSLSVSAEDAALIADLHPGQYLCLEVVDTGCGISRAVRERIFEPYFTTKDAGEGTGLGLSLVHGIVAALGGAINVYSKPGLGSTFKVYLPLIVGKTVRRPEERVEVAPGGDESVLLVDDEEIITRLERKLLEGLGYRVTVFDDSAEALQSFRDNPDDFDLILTDMTMPGMNGSELAREVMKIRPGKPIILCTGFSDLIDAGKARDLGISEFLLKPVTKGELAKAIRRALDGKPGAGGQSRP